MTATAPAGSAQIDLVWTASTDDITSQSGLVYEICLGQTSRACSSNFTIDATATTGVTSYFANGLSAFTTYYISVRAVDSAGNTGPISNEATAITDTMGTLTSPATSSDAAGTFWSARSVILSKSTGANICYTTNYSTHSCNGSGGCANGTQYTSAINVSVTQMINSIPSKTGYTSAASSAGYTLLFFVLKIFSASTQNT